MKKQVLAKLGLFVVAVGMVASGQMAFGDGAALTTDAQKVGYSFGMKIGSILKEQSIAAEPDSLGKGITAVVTYATPLLTPGQVSNVLVALPAGPKELPAWDKTFKSTKEEVGYALGLYFGRKVRVQEPKADIASLVQGVKDTLAGGKTLIQTNEIDGIFTADQARQTTELKAQGEKNAKDGPAFMEKNKSAPGVKVLTNGLQYQVMTAGTGPIPVLYDRVSVNYRGNLINGDVFDASAPGEPVTFPLTRVIKGWTKILKLMPVGSKWKVFIPAELAYGDQLRPPMIAPNSPLVFEIELLRIEPSSPAMKAGQDFLVKNMSAPGVTTLDDGLQYSVITAGKGPIPKPTDRVNVNYSGMFLDGKQFDASPPGQPFPCSLTGGVIPGWLEILRLMPTGSKWKVFIPSDLAYGERGSPPKIPADSTLIFEMELVSIDSSK